ncbi:hypothetical protein Fcan01_22648 [Folsomia candida]|uniref:Uncharacterized protein n=1 Tax=Folsomia candida TaxID=158441 RepID=A0A226DAS7_FOLCA|nr:hypothetical protein Fcan01_22648 [Folsomia candida]
MGIKVSLPVIVNYLRIDVWPAPAAVNSTVEQHGEIIIYNIPRDIVTLLPLSPRASSGGGMQIMCAAECVGSSERAEVVHAFVDPPGVGWLVGGGGDGPFGSIASEKSFLRSGCHMWIVNLLEMRHYSFLSPYLLGHTATPPPLPHLSLSLSLWPQVEWMIITMHDASNALIYEVEWVMRGRAFGVSTTEIHLESKQGTSRNQNRLVSPTQILKTLRI